MGIIRDLFSKPKPDNKSTILLGMVLLPDSESFSYERFVKDFKELYNDLKDLAGDDSAVAFEVEEEAVSVFMMEAPVPAEDIEGTAKYAYNWTTAEEDLKHHKAHIIIATTSTSKNIIKRFKLQTQVICSVLRVTNAIGVYLGNQSLLIPKNHYLSQAEVIDEGDIPLNLWLYFGLRTIDEKTNGYTYGLNAFGKEEMEVLNSDKKIFDIRKLLLDISRYILIDDVVFKNGQTIGFTEEQKLKITYSRGEFVEGMSFKIEY
jgi:hypothetical protein